MPYNFANISILVVDDNQAVLDLTGALLTNFNCRHIHAASDIDEAYNIFQTHDIDIVITDWQIPGGDGLALTKRIRTDETSVNPYVPILFMTAYGSGALVAKARDAGVTEFLSKPFAAEDLYNRLTHIIHSPRNFVMAEGFCGPDRRRRSAEIGKTAQRRYSDHQQETGAAELYFKDVEGSY